MQWLRRRVERRHNELFPRWVWCVVTSLGIVLVSCSGGTEARLGAQVPADAPVVSLVSVLREPRTYHGKEIILTGSVSGVCAAGCDFVLQDGTVTSAVYPSGFKVPKHLSGKRVRLYARVEAGTERPVITVLGMEPMHATR